MERVYMLIQKLIEIAMKKRDYFNELYTITNKQKTCMDNEDYTNLDKFIEDKQNIIEIVDKNDDVFNSTFIEVKNILAVDDISKVDIHRYPQFKELKLIIIDISNITKEIEIVDEYNRKMLKCEMDKVRSDIDKLNSSKRVTKVYNNYGHSDPAAYFFDTKK